MGMAASQARFLTLTARKSNTEYQGQQINQERTALANESSNIFTQLSKMDVPTPPNTNDFYKTVYTLSTKAFTENGTYQNYTFDQIISDPDGDFVNLTYDEKVYQKLANDSENGSLSAYTAVRPMTRVTNPGNGKSMTKDDIKFSVDDGLYSGATFSTANGTYAVYLKEVEKVAPGVQDALNDGNLKNGQDDYKITIDGKDYYAYISDGGKTKYLESKLFTPVDYEYEDEEGNKVSSYRLEPTSNNGCAYYISTGSQQRTLEDVKIISYVTNDTGRYTSLVLQGPDPKDGSEPQTFTCRLDCKSVQDEEAYEQAMLDYEHEISKYNKKNAELNAKTEEIQQKDKALELELKQLDTEQNAIKTEMDAVQKVTEDNVESTFKTFG